MKRFSQDEIVRDIVGSAAAHQELEAEYSQLEKDRDVLRSIFPSGNSKVIFQSIYINVHSPIFFIAGLENNGLPKAGHISEMAGGKKTDLPSQK